MNTEWKSCIRVCVSLFVLFLCINYWSGFAKLAVLVVDASMPLIIGGVIAYLVNILMSFYEKRYFPKKHSRGISKSRRPLCLAGAYLTMIAIVALVISLIVPQLIQCVQLIFEKLPQLAKYIDDLDKGFKIIPESVTDFLYEMDWETKIGQIAQILTSGIGSVMDGVVKTVSSVFSGTVTALLSIIFSVYLLMSKDTLLRQFNRVLDRYISKGINDKIRYVSAVVNDCFHNYIVGQCIEAVILGVLCTIGMMILRLPYASMIGALIAFTALIPIAGAYIGAVVGAFMIMTISPFKALVFIIFLIILQQIEGNLIYPKVVGSSIGLPGIWVLASITVGGGIMGIVGMLLGVPVTAVLYRILHDNLNKPILQEADANEQTDKEDTRQG